jgi:monoterpene epsilon-lactone hydrolase
MSFLANWMVPGSRLLKSIAYDQKNHRLRGLKMVAVLSKFALGSDKHVKIEPCIFEGLEAAWFTPENLKSDRVYLYLHGGGYSVCSWQTHQTLISFLCKETGMKALAINYRMAPEFPFPAAVEDTSKVLEKLVNEFGAHNVLVGGDSAGGGLSIAAILYLKDLKKPLPLKAFTLSPWLDLSVPNYHQQIDTNEDPMLDPESVYVWANRYLKDANSQNPYASPIYGDLKGLPPIMIQVGKKEMLLDESRLFVKKARASGVDIHIHEWDKMVHVFQLMHRILPEARESLREVAHFMVN